jgi:hypothetical protein
MVDVYPSENLNAWNLVWPIFCLQVAISRALASFWRYPYYRPVWITPGAAPIRWKGPIRNPRWKQKRTEGYVIVSKLFSLPLFRSPKDILKYWSKSRAGKVTHGAFHKDTVNFISSSAPHRYDNVTLIPLVLQLGLRIGPIQRMEAN